MKIHEDCVNALSIAFSELLIKKTIVLSDCYVIMKKVHKKFQKITEQIKITETNLLDLASVINYEIIQLDRIIIETRN